LLRGPFKQIKPVQGAAGYATQLAYNAKIRRIARKVDRRAS
jgi:hypothetical protein